MYHTAFKIFGSIILLTNFAQLCKSGPQKWVSDCCFMSYHHYIYMTAAGLNAVRWGTNMDSLLCFVTFGLWWTKSTLLSHVSHGGLTIFLHFYLFNGFLGSSFEIGIYSPFEPNWLHWTPAKIWLVKNLGQEAIYWVILLKCRAECYLKATYRGIESNRPFLKKKP